ncbi:MAG: c-type cytochrome domain-containing protein [Pirellulales bacterium]
MQPWHRSVVAAAIGIACLSGSPPLARGADGIQLAKKVQAIFEANCHRCHGQDGSNEGGLNFLLRLDKLVAGEQYIAAGKARESLIYQRLTDADAPMPPEGETPRPSPADVALVKQWIDAGAPAPSQPQKRDFISDQQCPTACKATC